MKKTENSYKNIDCCLYLYLHKLQILMVNPLSDSVPLAIILNETQEHLQIQIIAISVLKILSTSSANRLIFIKIVIYRAWVSGYVFKISSPNETIDSNFCSANKQGFVFLFFPILATNPTSSGKKPYNMPAHGKTDSWHRKLWLI